MLFDLNDTIIAVSSAPGYSRMGIIRLSGPKAKEAISKIWQHPNDDIALRDLPARQYLNGTIALEDNCIIPADIILFSAPNSYTTEDMVELYLPGSNKILNMVIETIKASSEVRDAHPGEFTARAFLNGRIDLTEAEAVAEVIHASGDAQLRAAENLLAGALHKKCSLFSQEISELLALVEAGIDFSDQEDISFIDRTDLSNRLQVINSQIKQLLAESVSWRDLHNLPRVVLVGPPNAGKSSLMNKLTQIDRSIVCSIAGTTRDILSAPVKLPMGECLLIDTPGLGTVDDVLADKSQQRVQDIISNADLVLLVWNPMEDSDIDKIVSKLKELSVSTLLLVANKCDLFGDDYLPESFGIESLGSIFVSALTGNNLDVLVNNISEILHFSENNYRTEAIALTVRQYTSLQHAFDSIEKLSDYLCETSLFEEEIVALHLREALDHIGAISGEIASDDVLGKIFSQFCIGK